MNYSFIRFDIILIISNTRYSKIIGEVTYHSQLVDNAPEVSSLKLQVSLGLQPHPNTWISSLWNRDQKELKATNLKQTRDSYTPLADRWPASSGQQPYQIFAGTLSHHWPIALSLVWEVFQAHNQCLRRAYLASTQLPVFSLDDSCSPWPAHLSHWVSAVSASAYFDNLVLIFFHFHGSCWIPHRFEDLKQHSPFIIRNIRSGEFK